MKNKLQLGVFIIGQILRLCKNSERQQTNLQNDCSLVVLKELCDNWINKNVYLLEGTAVARKIMKYSAGCVQKKAIPDIRKLKNGLNEQQW